MADDNVTHIGRKAGGTGIHPKPGRIARARKILLDDPLPPLDDLRREALNCLRQIIRDEECIENARVGAARTVLEYVGELGKNDHGTLDAEEWAEVEAFAAEMKGKSAG